MEFVFLWMFLTFSLTERLVERTSYTNPHQPTLHQLTLPQTYETYNSRFPGREPVSGIRTLNLIRESG